MAREGIFCAGCAETPKQVSREWIANGRAYGLLGGHIVELTEGKEGNEEKARTFFNREQDPHLPGKRLQSYIIVKG